MKLRYYLRGIGLGIIVAAAICMCATANNKKSEMTDEQIKARAEELGMIDSKTTLSDAATATEVNVVDSPDAGEFVEALPEEIEAPIEDVSTPEEDTEDKEADVEAKELEESKAEVEEPETEVEEPEAEAAEPETEVEEPEVKATGDIITIVVDKGNGSDTVARKLADAGLVPNANEYDKYLMANGYDRRIAAGTHKIPKGASDEEIAKLLTSKQD